MRTTIIKLGEKGHYTSNAANIAQLVQGIISRQSMTSRHDLSCEFGAADFINELADHLWDFVRRQNDNRNNRTFSQEASVQALNMTKALTMRERSNVSIALEILNKGKLETPVTKQFQPLELETSIAA